MAVRLDTLDERDEYFVSCNALFHCALQYYTESRVVALKNMLPNGSLTPNDDHHIQNVIRLRDE